MTGVEVAVGYVFAWLVRKARPVAARADAEVDRGLDAGMDRLHDLVSRKLGRDPALERAAEEAVAEPGQLSKRTRQRLVFSLEDAAEHDPAFARALTALVEQLQAAGPAAAAGAVFASDHSQVVTGPMSVTATGDRSIAAGQIGSVTMGPAPDPQVPGSAQG
ncbi:chromosome partitioning protein [Streptomyces sp. CB01373]|uniref:chromosome partitioning protein n=1 Tax=Streptomyces sp. CB01373 TaxID=2020325 RepID=UPI000C27C4CF|nr:chromosome partitioning protein [Streptomyces sp. CB01373]PJM93349.1 chromosome partitioning protein [Streptomyces sp. CB01373]